MIDTILMTVVPVITVLNGTRVTNATGFFFRRAERLFLVTSRHVFFDEPSGHFPSSVEIELHLDADDLTRTVVISVPLFRQGLSLWRHARDATGPVDVAAIEIDLRVLPESAFFHVLTPAHLPDYTESLEIGTPLLIVGFPLGFYDVVHRLPVARQATVASAFGVRFQKQGYFLTDARTHRGISGAPVVMRVRGGADELMPWKLVGIHSTRMDMGTRDAGVDEALGLNCAWYADTLMALTK
ncbi:trypsin-like peptidase domain-containing protein [Niveibacterium sp. SC-1]|uniref:trypsin-like peptidase domain-containing protein n=1 Tax=Niveibacterium sp. SC-1 TaxID=3135646 RepID=UPI00311FD76E